MKYGGFKIFKFFAILKKINRIRDGFSRNYKNIEDIPARIADFFGSLIKSISLGIYKSVKFVINGFLKIYKNIDFRKYNFLRNYKNIEDILARIADFFGSLIKSISLGIYKSVKFVINGFLKIYKNIDFRKYNFLRIYSYLNFKRYNFFKIFRKVKIVNYKNLTIYFFALLTFSGFSYLIVPMFINYNKSDIEKVICKDQNIECSIEGKIYYSFLPSPRIIIKDLKIQDIANKNNTLAKVDKVIIKLSIIKLLETKAQNFKKIELKDFTIDFNLKNIKKYKNFIVNKNNFIPLSSENGKIKFFDGKNYVAIINDANLNLTYGKKYNKGVLTGQFLNDDMYIKVDNKKTDNKPSINVILKMSNFNLLTKINFFSSEENKNIINGNILLKKNKNKFTAIFDYRNNAITIIKSNLRNIFLDGKLIGKISFLPYFNYDLDLDLNSINFTKLYNYFLSLDEKSKKNLFKINNKMNGKLNFSANKIYSRYNLVKSFESRIKIYNGNVSIEQFLLDLGKLGAADILGTINNDEKFTNFNFESNIFVDNQKKFLSKFSIYNKRNISSNLFISGNFDLENLRTSFYEISDEKKFSSEEINYIEQEFNNLMLEDGYESLFSFPKFKDFIKSITDEAN